MTATPATAPTHEHPGGIAEYHSIASARELRLHLYYGHDDETSGLDFDALAERHRQAHAGEGPSADEPPTVVSLMEALEASLAAVKAKRPPTPEEDAALARGAQFGEAFAGLGRTVPVGCAPTMHQKGECAGCSNPPGTFLVPTQTPEGPDPRALTGQAVEPAHPGGAVSASDPAVPSGHLAATPLNDRGFRGLPPIPGHPGGDVIVWESSSAEGPRLWLKVSEPHGARISIATVQLAAEDAWKLADQLRWLVEHHYQGDARPAWAKTSEGGDRQGATPAGPPTVPPSGPLDPATRMARVILDAYDALQTGTLSRSAIQACLADDIREALRSYR